MRTTDQGDTVTVTRFFISCTGMLSAPKVEPPFPGHEKYKGIIAHTARYPQRRHRPEGQEESAWSGPVPPVSR